MAKQTATFAASEAGEFDNFRGFMTRLVAIPHKEIRAKLEAEKAAKKDAKKASASRAPVSSHNDR